MVTADQLAWILGGALLSLLCWALAKIFDRTVADIAVLQTSVDKAVTELHDHEVRLTVLENRDE